MKTLSSLCFNFTAIPCSVLCITLDVCFFFFLFPIVPHLVCKPAAMLHMFRIHLDLQRLDRWLLAEKPRMRAQEAAFLLSHLLPLSLPVLLRLMLQEGEATLLGKGRAVRVGFLQSSLHLLLTPAHCLWRHFKLQGPFRLSCFWRVTGKGFVENMLPLVTANTQAI